MEDDSVVLSESLLDSIDDILTFTDYDDLLYIVENPETDIQATFDYLTEDQVTEIEQDLLQQIDFDNADQVTQVMDYIYIASGANTNAYSQDDVFQYNDPN